MNDDTRPAGGSIVRVAVPGPFREPLDYLLGGDTPAPAVGARVRAPLGRRRVIGIVMALAGHSAVPHNRLRAVEAVLDDTPVLGPETLALIRWASRYYHHPLGDCLTTALPTLLRQGRAAATGTLRVWHTTTAGTRADLTALARRAPRQAELLARLIAAGRLVPGELATEGGDWRGSMKRLVERGYASASDTADYGLITGGGDRAAPDLNPDQAAAVAAAREAAGRFQALLLDGVTGSGKTEVYLQAVAQAVTNGGQALVLVPEIGLTPQLVARFRRRLGVPMAVLHSGLADGERLSAWLAARDGAARVIIGTRSAVFAPLAAPRLIIVDEEHDASLKQQDGFRYSARDLAVIRASRLGIPILLGSATPSLESLHNAHRGRYRHLPLPRRAGDARPPSFRLLDMRGAPMRDSVSEPLIRCVGEHLDAGGQVLLFLNRRGYAPTLLCHECGWIAGCRRCDARLTYHQSLRRLRCHHCGYECPVDAFCHDCGSPDLRALGAGTERIETTIREAFPDVPLARIDRDSTRRRGAFEARFAAARRGETRILLGTQMLAKGHHLPAVTLVGVIDADQGLFGADFRAPERLAQLVVQVAGRAGRGDRPGEVVIQTHHPEHPLLQVLVEEGYPRFAADALTERRLADLPPFSHLALVRAEAVDAAAPLGFLESARELAMGHADGVELLGPMPAPMERRAGRYRAQLLLQSPDRNTLQALLRRWLPDLAGTRAARRVRWSVDVDPVEML